MRPPPISDQLYRTPKCFQWNPYNQKLSQKYPAARRIFNSLLSVPCNISCMKHLEVSQKYSAARRIFTLFSVFHPVMKPACHASYIRWNTEKRVALSVVILAKIGCMPQKSKPWNKKYYGYMRTNTDCSTRSISPRTWKTNKDQNERFYW